MCTPYIPIACASSAGFSSGSTMKTWEASMRFNPLQPCLMGMSNTHGAPAPAAAAAAAVEEEEEVAEEEEAEAVAEGAALKAPRTASFFLPVFMRT